MNSENIKNPASNCQFLIDGLREIIGQAGVSAVLKTASQLNVIEEGNVHFSDLHHLGAALGALYGPRGGKGIAMRSGRASLKYFLRLYGRDLQLNSIEFRIKPTHKRLKEGLSRLVKAYHDQFGINVNLIDDGATWIWQSENCTECQERQAAEAVCQFTEGLLQEFLSWCGGSKIYAVSEISCCAHGDKMCQYRIDPYPIE